MNELTFYQEMVAEATKRRINAEADEDNALDLLFGLKMNYIEEQIAKKNYYIDGFYRKPVLIERYKTKWPEDEYDLIIYFAVVPETLRKYKDLTEAEEKLLKTYEDNVYSKIRFEWIVEKNKKLIDWVLRSDLHRDMWNCKNGIELILEQGWSFSFDELMSEDFVERGLCIDDEAPLW